MDITANVEPTTTAGFAPDLEALLDGFGLTDLQKGAARERRRDVAVTAGAGSGKTRTLVARYLPLLVECGSPRRVVAITFTEKAAREMRNRVRKEIRALIERADEAEKPGWVELEAQLDAARIGTIHSLCAEILRAHPAEAGLDPQFGVLEEGQMAILRARAVSDALAWAVDQEPMGVLFTLFKLHTLEKMLAKLLERRLDVQFWLAGRAGNLREPGEGVMRVIDAWLGDVQVVGIVEELREVRESNRIIDTCGEKLGGMVLDLLACLDQAETCLRRTDAPGAAQALFNARRQHMRGAVGSAGRIKEAVKELKDLYDDRLAWLGGAQAKDPPPNPALDHRVAGALPAFLDLYTRALEGYQAALRQRNAVDFDTLEGTALELLRNPVVAERWQAEISAVLVDEFQDTNARQRDIVRALCGGQPGRLFVVGDARQSIYRFRGADVTVFRGLQDEIRARDGLSIDLDLTFRTHHELLSALGDLLADQMGVDPQPSRPYYVPFTPLNAYRQEPGPGKQAPHVELVLAAGQDTDDGRAQAARTLASRLLELKRAGQIRTWDEVTLLFRASTGFPAYEDAFEAARIPYVTAAGRGFYDRPEVRDSLNLLRALSNPWDDLAVTGLLRSPAFGLSEAGLYDLRWRDGKKVPLFQTLQSDLSSLAGEDQLQAAHARDFLMELTPWVDRVPVAELIQRVLTFTDYRTILAGSSSRLWRNLDKLLADARTSQVVQVEAFLEYLKTLKDAGVREGEAAAEAEGAVGLMSIHKSKGLEFGLVVLADAARQGPTQGEPVYLHPGSGLALKPDRVDELPLAYRYAQWLDRDQSEAETQRLLYVALTRAKEKVIVSGHLTRRGDMVETRGWLKDLLGSLQIDLPNLAKEPGSWQTVVLPGRQPVGVWLAPEGETDEQAEIHAPAWPTSTAVPLFQPVVPAKQESPAGESDLPESQEDDFTWRVTGPDPRRYARAVGQMVHKAIQTWRFPGDSRLEGLLRAAAFENGLVGADERAQAQAEAETLLGRFRLHPLWREMDRAVPRLHEVPYALRRRDGRVENGFLDVLYQTAEGWQIADFKTDRVQSTLELDLLQERYAGQMRRYINAGRSFVGRVVRARLVFLDDRGQVSVVDGFD